MYSSRDTAPSLEPILEMTINRNDLLLTGFTFDEVQTLKLKGALPKPYFILFFMSIAR